MKFVKSAFLSICFACAGMFLHHGVLYAIVCNGNVPPGYFCNAGSQETECRAGCYCPGGDTSAAIGINVANQCGGGTEGPDPKTNYSVHVGGKAFKCPRGYTSYNGIGFTSKEDCYKYQYGDSGRNVKYVYHPAGCGSGRYLPEAETICATCPAGRYCNDDTPIISEFYDQGISGSCNTENRYSTSGASQCTECTENGRAVKKNNAGTLNVGCDVCDDGTYANDGHTACEFCEAGYACTNGMRTQCTGNQYSGAGASQCSVCNGAGYAVNIQNGLNVGCQVCPRGTYANADHTQCVDCPAGHACSNGVDNGLCQKGTCAAYQGHSGGYHCVNVRGVECKTCSEIDSSKPYSIPARTQCVKCDNPVDYYENGECQNCPNVEYNQTLYTRVRIDGQSGKAMCGIKLNTSSSNTPSLCSVESLVQWHIVNDAWKLVEEFSVKADMTHYVKDPSPTSPDGSDADADWCGTCPDGKFNIYANRTGESACVACPAGYCTSGNSCLKCRAGYYCPGTNGVANSCSGGTVVVDGERYGIEQTEEEEYKCKKGSFSAPGQVSCTKCASGYTTDIEGKPYYPDHDDLNEICQKIKIRLMFNNNQWKNLPDIFKNVKMNASVLQPQQ